VVSLWQHGIDNAVAVLGTAATPHHVRTLVTLTNEILFCFDGDDAGRRAAWRALEQSLEALKDGVTLRFACLPEGEDPDSLV
ncbi:toprim domain-containing protein, partial [Klebsiella pneumoniae]|nr:toprim domain-containing protein [Klebsiella pneumoniae]